MQCLRVQDLWCFVLQRLGVLFFIGFSRVCGFLGSQNLPEPLSSGVIQFRRRCAHIYYIIYIYIYIYIYGYLYAYIGMYIQRYRYIYVYVSIPYQGVFLNQGVLESPGSGLQGAFRGSRVEGVLGLQRFRVQGLGRAWLGVALGSCRC